MFIFQYCFVCQYQSSDWLVKSASEMTYCVSGGALNSTHSLAHLCMSGCNFSLLEQSLSCALTLLNAGIKMVLFLVQLQLAKCFNSVSVVGKL